MNERNKIPSTAAAASGATPRTDAKVPYPPQGHTTEYWFTQFHAMTDHACQLERELNALRSAIESNPEPAHWRYAMSMQIRNAGLSKAFSDMDGDDEKKLTRLLLELLVPPSSTGATIK